MKVLWRSYFIVVFLLSFAAGVVCANEKRLRRKEALIVAEQTGEVAALYGLRNGELTNCIEKSVKRPCESSWVTCIEDAWVVAINVGEMCPVKHDGRLSVTIVVNDITGQIISKFPEKPYFESPFYCLEDYDCMGSLAEGEKLCQNFIYSQLYTQKEGDFECLCQEHICQPKEAGVHRHD